MSSTSLSILSSTDIIVGMPWLWNAIFHILIFFQFYLGLFQYKMPNPNFLKYFENHYQQIKKYQMFWKSEFYKYKYYQIAPKTYKYWNFQIFTVFGHTKFLGLHLPASYLCMQRLVYIIPNVHIQYRCDIGSPLSSYSLPLILLSANICWTNHWCGSRACQQTPQ